MDGEPIDMYGDGSSRRDYTYIDDIIDGTVAALDRCSGYEIINLGDSRPVPLQKMISTIEQACGIKAVINRVDPMPGDVNQTYADIEKAGRLLDYSPKVDFEEGIRTGLIVIDSGIRASSFPFISLSDLIVFIRLYKIAFSETFVCIKDFICIWP